MTEIDTPREETPAATTATEVEGTAGFGRRLTLAREKLGLSIADIAARLRLHPKQIAAIESEMLPALPAPVLRGFVRKYAKEVNLDPASMLVELNERLGTQSGGPSQLGSGTSAARSTSERNSRPWVIAAVIGLLVVFAVLGWFATHSEKRGEAANEAPKTAPPVAAPATSPGATPTSDAVTAAPTESSASAAAAVTPAPSAPLVAAAPGPTPAAATATPTLAPGEGVHLSFRDQSWVEVTQADGRVIHSQLNAAGTEQRIDAKPPLRLVIGNASSVSLDYKGKPVDLKPLTNAENVARVSLN